MKGMSTEMRIPTVGAAASLVAERKVLMAHQQKIGKKVRSLACFFAVPVSSWLISLDTVVFGGPVWSQLLPCGMPVI